MCRCLNMGQTKGQYQLKFLLAHSNFLRMYWYSSSIELKNIKKQNQRGTPFREIQILILEQAQNWWPGYPPWLHWRSQSVDGPTRHGGDSGAVCPACVCVGSRHTGGTLRRARAAQFLADICPPHVCFSRGPVLEPPAACHLWGLDQGTAAAAPPLRNSRVSACSCSVFTYTSMLVNVLWNGSHINPPHGMILNTWNGMDWNGMEQNFEPLFENFKH